MKLNIGIERELEFIKDKLCLNKYGALYVVHGFKKVDKEIITTKGFFKPEKTVTIETHIESISIQFNADIERRLVTVYDDYLPHRYEKLLEDRNRFIKMNDDLGDFGFEIKDNMKPKTNGQKFKL